ncbi:DUF3967 domain-containing protein [Bacillus cereus]
MKTLYSPGDVAEQLGIQSSTLRKYADVFEKKGYTFIKNERGHRKYRKSDVMVFRKVINLKSDMKLSAMKNRISTLQTMLQDQNDVIEKQNELLQELSKRLNEQDQRFEQRESELLSAIKSIQDSQKLIATNSNEDIAKNQSCDEMLMQTIREVLEVKKLIVASKSKKWYEFWK